MDCLVVDIGNTSVAFGRAVDGRIVRRGRLPTRIRDVKGVSAALATVADGARRPEGSVIASVVPTATSVWLRALRAWGDIIEVSHKTRLGVGIDYPKPRTIGPDRLANACGAVARYGKPVIVADFGTALTFDVISREGNYIGGVIAPGLPLMTDYLAERTALLPHVRIGGRCPAIGRSTEGAIRVGACVGYRGAVREIVAHLRESCDLKDASLCATGGFAAWALRGLDLPFVIDSDLTLFGLARIRELNS